MVLDLVNGVGWTYRNCLRLHVCILAFLSGLILGVLVSG